MKRTDLYRGFDSIKPSKELKADILKAVKEKDKVTVIKRPLFVPIMVVMLVCLNFGMVAKLVIFNKSQINMADLRARTSISQASEASKDDFVLSEDTRKTVEFQAAVDEFQWELDDGEYCLVYEWRDYELITPSQILPYYIEDWQLDYQADNEDSQKLKKYLYRRYAKMRDVMANIDSDSPTDSSLICLTNDEVIVGYDGDCTPDNIVSITHSNVDTDSVSDQELAEGLKQVNAHAGNRLEDYAIEKLTAIDPDKKYKVRDYGVVSNMCIYPIIGSNNKPRILRCCFFQCSGYLTSNNIHNIYEKLYLTEQGDLINRYDLFTDFDNCWKETLYRTDAIGSDMVQIPDVIGMDIDEAKKVIEDAGLKLGWFTYDAPYSVVYKYNQVMSIYCFTEIECARVHDLVPKGSEVHVTICAESAKWKKN